MSQGRLSSAERVSSVAAILLFVFMFFHWFGVKAINTSNLLFAIQAGGPGKSAWEALDYIPIALPPRSPLRRCASQTPSAGLPSRSTR